MDRWRVWALLLGGGLGVDPGGGLEWCSAAAFRGVRAAHGPHEETFRLYFHLCIFLIRLAGFYFLYVHPAGGKMKIKKVK